MKKIIFLILTLILVFSVFSYSASADRIQTPRIIETLYKSDELVIADIVVTEAPYNADPTGVNDCTSSLQRALDDCASTGGGTVFLPVGNYRLTGNIKIPQFVTLMGDWQDPDIGADCGTLIIADVKSEDIMSPGLITVGASAGAVGLTVWYPNQSIEDVKPYPFTFYIEGNGDYMLQTVRNCTLLNSYRGIGASSECENGIYQCHEMLNVENVKGTCLYQGLHAYNSADVDTVKTLYLLNKYWAEAGEDFNAPDIDKLNAYTRKNCIGMVLGDLEWPEFCDIRISDCKYGIIVRKGIRASFSGSFSDLYITDCDYGFYADKGAIGVRGKQWGASILNGVIDGSVKALYNAEKSYIGLTNVEVNGKIDCKNIQRNTAEIAAVGLDWSHRHVIPAAKLFVAELDKTGRTDISAQLQKLLDDAGKTGGIVYIPGGLYRIDAPITVPAGVELRGSSSVAARCQGGNSSGTLIISYYGYSEDAKPLIRLGESAGISGIRIDYPLNNPTDASGKYLKTSPTVYSDSDGVYIVNTAITLPSCAVLLENSKNAYIKKLVGCSMENMITLNRCSDTYIEGCLQNGTTYVRNGYSNIDIPELKDRTQEADLFTFFFDPITRINADYICLSDCEKITVFNTFIYGGRSFLTAKNSGATLVNVGCDGSSKLAYTFNMEGGDTTILNSMRSTSDGQESYKLYSGSCDASVKIFNSQAVDLTYHEDPVMKNADITKLPEKQFFQCLLQPLFNIIHRIITKMPIVTAIAEKLSLESSLC